ncbi:hypothetical protein Bca52824_058357 [Brassica carinata]|uniref:Uncharacterized protein n=1 Tax=Brassica carinata TaxID=52824 RepID=A0A8X7QTT4_BRACI|nr:hypothetical protein Bca52824_058357 [Brassica carinata]
MSVLTGLDWTHIDLDRTSLHHEESDRPRQTYLDRASFSSRTHLHFIIKGAAWLGRIELDRASASTIVEIVDWTEGGLGIYRNLWPVISSHTSGVCQPHASIAACADTVTHMSLSSTEFKAPDGGEVVIYEAYLEAGFRGVIPSLIGEVSSFFGFCPSQLTPLTWRPLMAIQVLGKLPGFSVGVHEILYFYYFAPLMNKAGFYHLIRVGTLAFGTEGCRGNTAEGWLEQPLRVREDPGAGWLSYVLAYR